MVENFRNMKYTFIFLLSLFLLACNNESKPAGEAESTETNSTSKPVLVTKSMKTAYAKYLDKRKGWYSAKYQYEKGKLNPFDEALRDTAFFIFRESLLESIVQKDVFSLLDKVDENIKCSFGDRDGSAAFVEMWGLDSPSGIDSSLVWAVLESVLTKGGAFGENESVFVAPYYQAKSLEGFSNYSHGLVLGRGVRMRKSPNLTSAIVKNLSYDIVEVSGYSDEEETIGGETHQWAKVKLLDGKEGYVWGKFIINPLGYRVGFKRQKAGEWLMNFLVAED